MADFLTSMIQRTLGLLPVVQPMIASKYGSESMGAEAPGALTLLAPFPGSVAEEPFEHWEEPAEQLPPAALPQPPVPHGVHTPTPAVRGAPPSVASFRQQPSTAPAQQANSAPVRPQVASSRRETTGGNSPSPFVPQPQSLPARNESLPLASRSPAKNAPPAAGESREVVSPQPQSDAASASPFVSTTRPRRGQGNHSAHSYQPMGSTPLVPAQSRVIPAIPQLSQAGARVAPNKKSGEKQPVSPSPIDEESSFTGVPPTLVPSPLPVPANTSNNPAINRGNIAHARLKGREMTLVPEPGQSEPEAGPGQPYTPQYTKPNAIDLYRVGEAEQEEPERRQSRQSQPYPKNSTADPHRLEEAGQREPGPGQALVAPTLRAESELMKPLLPLAYTPIQSRRTIMSAAGKRAEVQLSETPGVPTIRVTIGRIDVRAVPPTPSSSPAPTKSNRARPALSLSDYLKQRKGG